MESITNRLDQVEERILEIKDDIRNYLIQNTIMEKEEIENGHPLTGGITRKDPPQRVWVKKNTGSFKKERNVIIYKAKPARIRPDHLTQMLKVRRTWTKVFLATKQTIFLPGLLNLVAIL